MKKKRMIKLLMSLGCDRNDAARAATLADGNLPHTVVYYDLLEEFIRTYYEQLDKTVVEGDMTGAVSGMLMAAGMIRGYTEPRNPTAKAEHYQFVQSLANAFKVRNGSIICRELLKGTVPAEVLRPDTPPEVRTEEYYKKRPCPELIGDAAELLEQMLQQERISKKD